MKRPGNKVRTVDVAVVANASQSTVSRALAGDPRISEVTRKRVLAAAEKLGYRPNLIARGLKNQSTGIVGVIVTNLDNSYHAHALRLLVDELGECGFAPLVSACNNVETANRAIAHLLSYQVDAVIALAAPFDHQLIRSASAAGKPLTLMNRYSGDESISSVGSDEALGGALVAAHLVAAGARRFGFFSGEDGTEISHERETGFRSGLAKAGFNCDARTSSPYVYETARKAARALLADPPDAVFCANDTLAFALIDAARAEFGLSVPGDLMVAGYDNSALAGRPPYDLTSVDQNLKEIVRLTVSHTSDLVETKDHEPIAQVVAPHLVTRGSTAAQSLPGGVGAKGSD